ncbi:hypothetical protein [Ensifer canadensis]
MSEKMMSLRIHLVLSRVHLSFIAIELIVTVFVAAALANFALDVNPSRCRDFPER